MRCGKKLKRGKLIDVLRALVYKIFRNFLWKKKKQLIFLTIFFILYFPLKWY